MAEDKKLRETNLINGESSMKSKIKLSLDEYFKFLEDYFELFNFQSLKRRPLTGKNFKI